MAINWNFNADDYKENSFAPIPVGDHRVRIRDAEETISKNGKDMIKLTMDVSGYSSTLWYYITFEPTNPQMTNNKLGQVFSSFGIKPGDLNLDNWKGKAGAARIKHRQYNGETQADVAYFLVKEKQEQLPAWQEPAGKASVTGGGFAETTVDEGDLPF